MTQLRVLFQLQYAMKLQIHFLLLRHSQTLCRIQARQLRRKDAFTWQLPQPLHERLAVHELVITALSAALIPVLLSTVQLATNTATLQVTFGLFLRRWKAKTAAFFASRW